MTILQEIKRWLLPKRNIENKVASQKFKETILDFKKEYPKLHYHYDSAEGWCVISWKGKQIKVTDQQNILEIESLIRHKLNYYE